MIVAAVLGTILLVSVIIGIMVARKRAAALRTVILASEGGDVDVPMLGSSPYYTVPFIVGGASFLILGLLQIFIPPNNVAIFQERKTVLSEETSSLSQNIQTCTTSPSGIITCDTHQEIREIVANIKLVYPEQVPVQQDFSITISGESEYPAWFRSEKYSASLFAPKYLEARTTQPCEGKSPAGVAACYEGQQPSFLWDATPVKTGSAVITIKSDIFARTPPGSERKVIKINTGDSNKEFSGQETNGTVGGVEIDLTRHELRFAVRILTSLGVSQATFDWVKVMGAVLAALGTILGAGFGMKVFQRPIVTPEGTAGAPRRRRR